MEGGDAAFAKSPDEGTEFILEDGESMYIQVVLCILMITNICLSSKWLYLSAVTIGKLNCSCCRPFVPGPSHCPQENERRRGCNFNCEARV